MVVDPLERRVGEHEVEALVEPGGDVALGEGEPGHVGVRRLGPGQHRRRRVDPDRLLGRHLLVQDLGQVARAAPEVDDAPARDGVAQRQEIVERLLAFRTEPLVLVGAPPVDRSHGHRPHV